MSARRAAYPGSAACAVAVARTLHQPADDGMTVSSVTCQCLLGHLALQHLAVLLNAAALQQAGQVLQASSPVAEWEACHRSKEAEPASSEQHVLPRSWLGPGGRHCFAWWGGIALHGGAVKAAQKHHLACLS